VSGRVYICVFDVSILKYVIINKAKLLLHQA